MKRLILTAFVATLAVNSFGQGAIDVGNNFGATVFRAPIYGVQVGNETQSVSGQPGTPAFPTGPTVYTGARLQGTGFTFAFYASTTGITTDAGSLTFIGALNFGATAGTAGFVTTQTLNVPGVTAGNPTTWQIRVWDSTGGHTTLAAAWNAGLAGGQSALVNSGPLGGVSPGGPVLNPATSSGWTSFNVYVVPEPSTFVLAGLGAAALLIFRRRK
jgi:hypothetical protein